MEKTILIVDDNKTFLTFLSLCLEEFHDFFTVVTAHNGREAIKVFNSQVIDLIITDLQMPEISGLGLLSYLHNKNSAPPVFVMSGCTSERNEKIVKNLNAKRYLTKPLNIDNLIKEIFKELAIQPF